MMATGGIAYFVSALLFVVAFWGLSRPTPARGGNWCAIAGMMLATGTTLVIHNAAVLPQILIALTIGGAGGLLAARRVTLARLALFMTVFRLLGGLAALLVGIGAWRDPMGFGINDMQAICDLAYCRQIGAGNRVGLGLGVALGATVLSGSVVAFIVGPQRDGPSFRGVPMLCTMVAIIVLIGFFAIMPGAADLLWSFWGIIGLALLLGGLLSFGGGRMVAILLDSCSGWAAVAYGFMFQNIAMVVAGALVGTCCAIHGVRTIRPRSVHMAERPLDLRA